MSKDNTVKTTLSLPEELYWRWQQAIPERRSSNKQSVIEALQTWIDGPDVSVTTPPSSSTQPQSPWHQKLDIILTKGSPRDVVGIQQNIDWAVRAITGGVDPAVLKSTPPSVRPDTVLASEINEFAALATDPVEELSGLRQSILTLVQEYMDRRAKIARREAAAGNAAEKESGPNRIDRSKRRAG